MASRSARHHYCRCGTHLAADNPGRQCARCARASRDKLIAPPTVPPEFWQTEQFREAFTAQHIGRVARAYRTHPHHNAVYGLGGISQTLLGQWLGLRQPQVSRLETGPPIQHLDTLQRWAWVLRIPPLLLWFRLPEDKGEFPVTEPAAGPMLGSSAHGVREALAQSPSRDVQPGSDTSGAHPDDPEHDPVLVAPWNHRGTVEAAIMLSGGDDRVKRRIFLSLTGTALTAPAHQWLVHEPEPLMSGLAGRRVPAGLVDRLIGMIAELRKMDDVAGGGSVLSLAQHEFSWVAGLLDQALYDERTGRALHVALAELGQLCGWAAYDAGHQALAQRYYIAALRATHSAGDRPLGAHVLSCMAEQAARQGQPAEAVTLIETALAGVRGQQIPSLLANLYTGQAYAFATLGDASDCTAAVSKARTQIDRLTPAAGPPWLYWVNPANMTSEVGNSLRQLGHAEQAAMVLENGIAMFDDSLPRGRLGYLIHLADTLVRPGKQCDLDAAADRGMEAIQLAQNLDSTRSASLISNLYQQLQPHAKEPAVRDFLERARGFTAA